METIKKYFKLLDNIICSLLDDFSHLRFWLIILGYVFNILILGMVYLGKADYKLSGIGIALLTAIYTFYFASKDKQANHEQEIKIKMIDKNNNGIDDAEENLLDDSSNNDE